MKVGFSEVEDIEGQTETSRIANVSPLLPN
jgi:hypothetical protein